MVLAGTLPPHGRIVAVQRLGCELVVGVISGATCTSLQVDIQMMFSPFPGGGKPIPLFLSSHYILPKLQMIVLHRID